MRSGSPRAAAFAVVVVCVVACHRAHPADAGDVPRIDAVRPDSVLVPPGGVVEVVILGHGFAPGQPGVNTVEFAGMSLTKVPANARGTEVRFVIPDMIALGGEAPPASLESGTYTVRIKTGAGVSNPVTIRVYR